VKLVLAAVIFLVLYQVWGKDALAPRPVRTAPTGQVVLYATDWCPYCRQARTLLKEQGVQYVEYDIEKSEEGKRQYDALNVRGVPVLNVNGIVVKGYDRKAILAALKSRA
jgi:glutaredoxin